MSNALSSIAQEPAEDSLWEAGDVAKYLKASVSWVRKATAAGRLPCVRLGAMVRYHPEQIKAWSRGESGGQVIRLPRR
jgi:excisionase family DNA binding protein